MFLKSDLNLLTLLILTTLLFCSCQESAKSGGETYLYVADDFTQVAVESAPRLKEEAVKSQFRIIALNEAQELPDKPGRIKGSYTLSENRIGFMPETPFTPGKTYRAIFRYRGDVLERDFYVSAHNGSPTFVKQVYPSQPYLIQNLQRIYIKFSAPMAEGHAFQNIHFIGDYGDTVRYVFAEPLKERWNADHTLLRLDLEPIPYVQGIPWHEALGKRFKLFQKYRLVVENEMRDAQGHKLSNDYQKQFIAYGPRLQEAGIFRVVTLPQAGSREPVILSDHKSHDYVSLLKSMRLTNKAGEKVPGTVEITDYESSWVFTPDQPWQAGEHKVYISDFIEDVAGNTRTTSVRDWKINRKIVYSKDSSEYSWPISFWPKK